MSNIEFSTEKRNKSNKINSNKECNGVGVQHFTPQQLSKLINLHIKTSQCVNCKCQKEKKQLLNTISKLAKHFYDFHAIIEKQRQELKKVVNFYNDICAQFALPNRLETPKQYEFANMEKIARTIHDNFINKSNEEKHKNMKFPNNINESMMTNDGITNPRVTSSKSPELQKSPTTSSIIALDDKSEANRIAESRKRKIDSNDSMQATNGKSFHSHTEICGSTFATPSSSSPHQKRSKETRTQLNSTAPSPLIDRDHELIRNVQLLDNGPSVNNNDPRKRNSCTVSRLDANRSSTAVEALNKPVVTAASALEQLQQYSSTNNTVIRSDRINRLEQDSSSNISVTQRAKLQHCASTRELKKKGADRKLDNVNHHVSHFPNQALSVGVGVTALIAEGDELSLGLLKNRQSNAVLQQTNGAHDIIQLDDDDII